MHKSFELEFDSLLNDIFKILISKEPLIASIKNQIQHYHHSNFQIHIQSCNHLFENIQINLIWSITIKHFKILQYSTNWFQIILHLLQEQLNCCDILFNKVDFLFRRIDLIWIRAYSFLCFFMIIIPYFHFYQFLYYLFFHHRVFNKCI